MMDELQREFLKRLIECEAYYECPKDADGRRIGPLVGYAGKYPVNPDDPNSERLAYVGEVYYNIAAVEQRPLRLRNFTGYLSELIHADSVRGALRHHVWSELTILAAPMGGLSVGLQLAERLGLPYGFAEKQVTQAAVDGKREESKLVLSRHELKAGQKVILVEDVCNNFSTTAAIRDLVRAASAELVAVACLVNRSPDVIWEGLPVISMGHMPTAQFRQDDPFVAEDIASGRVVWKPKAEWPELMALLKRCAN